MGSSGVGRLLTAIVTTAIVFGLIPPSPAAAVDGDAQAIATITVTQKPMAAAVNPTTNRLYVVSQGSGTATPGTLTVISGTDNTILATVAVGANPSDVVVNEATNRVYVVNNVGDSVSVIDGATNRVVATLPARNPLNAALDATRARLYVATTSGLLAFDTVSNTQVASTASYAFGIAVNTVTNRLFVGNLDTGSVGSVSVLDGANLGTTVATITVSGSPNNIAVDETRNRIYVASASGGPLSVIDGATNTVIGTITLATGASATEGLSVDPGRKRLYVAHESASKLAIIDTTSDANTILAQVAVGQFPQDAAVNIATDRVYVPNFSSDSVSVIGAPSLPDLAVTAVSAPSTVTTGTSISYSWTVTNRGTGTATATANSWADQAWISPSATSIAGAYPAGGIVAPGSLSAGSSYQRSFTATLGSIPPGSYWFIIETDSNSQLGESNESNNLSVGVPITVTAPAPRIAYVYKADTAARDAWAAFLSSRGFAVDAIAAASVEGTDFSPYRAILIGNDTGSGGRNAWGTAAAVSKIASAGKRIISLGDGGSQFFDTKAGGRSDIGWLQSWYASGSAVDVADGSLPAWTTPNSTGLATNATATLYTAASQMLAVFTGVSRDGYVQMDTTPIGRQQNDADHYPIIAQGCDTLWGFVASASTLTALGKDVFENLLSPCALVSISAEVREDLDGDGVFDANEPFLTAPRIEVFRVNADGTRGASVGSAVNSPNITVSGIAAGTFEVVETDPVGYASTSPNTVRVTVAVGSTSMTRFMDAPSSARGVAQYTETPNGTTVTTLLLGGATVSVRSAAGLQDTTTANATTGAYSFNGLAGNTAYVATYDLTVPTGRRYLVNVPFTTNAVGGAAIPPPAPVFNRKNHGWLTAFRIGDGVPVPDQISREGQATWYRLAITPQTQVTINVSGCTFDCNVVVYRDLFQVATALRAGSTSLSGIRTDLAGNIAADDMDADDMDADDMDADDMDADDMDADDMDADDMDADDMDADDMDADDMDADDMDADDMDADDMDADDMDADGDGLTGYGPVYLAAQRKGVRAASVSEGLAPETITINTRSLTGDLFIRVKGDTVTDVGTFTVSAVRTPQASCVGAPLIARLPSTPATALAAGKRSLILTDSSAFAPAERAQVLAKLTELAAHATVNGYVLDLAADANIALLRADWLAKPTCVAQGNLLTDAIRGVVQLARTRSQIEYLIIGGGDRIVPFRREADWAEISRESRYSPPVLGSSASDASLVTDTILTDDFYATATPIERVNRTLYLPDIAVGRLVESAADIAAYVDMYVAQNGRAAPTTALSSGYDFTLDLAQYVTAQLQARGLAVDSSLVSNTWSAADWRNAVLAPTSQRFGILSLQGHFSANRLVPADNGQRVLSTELAGAGNRLQGSLVYSLGCHSGYSIVNADAIPALTQPLAFPEAFLRQGATLVGGTGYQYGETVLMKNTEALIALLTTELGYSTDARGVAYGAAGVPIGKALMNAKRAYMGDTATPRGIDFKVVGVSTVYGSPTMSFALPNTVARPQPGTVSPDFSSGVGVLDVIAVTTPTRDGAVGSPSYYTGTSGTTVAPYRPIAPLVTIPAEAVGSVLAGVVFMGGAYTEEQGFIPRLSIPATEESGEAPRYVNDTFSPTRPVRTNLFDGDAVQLIPFQYRSDATGTQGTARVFGDVHYRAYYSSVTGAAAIVDAPPIERVNVAVVPTGIEVRASVRGHTLAEIADVYVTYTDTSAASRSFASVQMTAGSTVSDGTGFSGFTREYTGIIPAGANAAAIRFMVQAVSGTGRVEVAANGGQLYRVVTASATAPAASTLQLNAPPSGATYRSMLNVSATLLPAAAGRTITFRLGATFAQGTTNAAGVATATLRVTVVPRTTPYDLTATFAGNSGVQEAGASAPVLVQRAPAALVPVPAGSYSDRMAIARLVSGGVTLNEQTIVLSAGVDAGVRQVATASDAGGVVRLEAVDLALLPGDSSVTVSYPGSARFLPALLVVPVTVPAVSLSLTSQGPQPTGPITFRAQVTRAAGSTGDLARATVEYTFRSRSSTVVTAVASVGSDGRSAVTLSLPAGLYAIEARVGGAFASAPVSGSTVVFDAKASVTAGGWLPASAAGTPATPARKTTLAFSAKYKPDGATPDGTLLVQLGDEKGSKAITIRGTSIEWVVVAGNTADVIGTATVDGKAGFRFRITAEDLAADTVEIRVWDPATGSEAAPLYKVIGELGGGSVRLHNR